MNAAVFIPYLSDINFRSGIAFRNLRKSGTVQQALKLKGLSHLDIRFELRYRETPSAFSLRKYSNLNLTDVQNKKMYLSIVIISSDISSHVGL